MGSIMAYAFPFWCILRKSCIWCGELHDSAEVVDMHGLLNLILLMIFMNWKYTFGNHSAGIASMDLITILGYYADKQSSSIYTMSVAEVLLWR